MKCVKQVGRRVSSDSNSGKTVQIQLRLYICIRRPNLAHLEITAQQQKIHLDPLLLFCFLDRRVDIAQTSVGTTFYGDLYFGGWAVRDLCYRF
jgi:hypothetical protein